MWWIRIQDEWRHKLEASFAYREDVLVFRSPVEDATYFTCSDATFHAAVTRWLDSMNIVYQVLDRQAPPASTS